MSTKEIQQAVCNTVNKLPNRDKIRKIRLFGSYMHGTHNKGSDIDLLIDFDESASVGYFELVRLQDAFEKALGKNVDVVTPRALSKYFRDEVLKEAQMIYKKRSDTN